MLFPENGQIPSIYKTAIGKSEKITGKSLDAPDIRNLKTVEDLKAQIEHQHHKYYEFRKRDQTFFNVQEGAMMPVELFDSLASGAASMAFPPSSLVFGAVTHLINAAKGVTASYDAI